MRIITIFVVMLILLGTLFSSEPIRKWRTKSGGEMEAAWDIESDGGGESIRLIKEGKKYKVSVEKLSEEDIKYVQDRRAELASRGTDEFSDFELDEEESKPDTAEETGSAAGEEVKPAEITEETPEEARLARANASKLKKQIEEKIKAGGELPEEYLNSQG